MYRVTYYVKEMYRDKFFHKWNNYFLTCHLSWGLNPAQVALHGQAITLPTAL